MFKKKPKPDAEVPGGSLADISFLILIFFMVATTIDMDKGIGFVLPPDSDEEINMAKDKITNVVIDPTGRVLMDEKPVEKTDIKDEASRLLASQPKMVFSVKSHARTDYQDYITVIDQLKAAKAKNISVAQ